MPEEPRLWTPTNDTPQWMLQCAQEVNDKYPNLSLSWIPPDFRGPEDTRPFAIVEVDHDGNITGLVARFSEFEFYPANIFNWLYDHDTHNTDVWANYIKDLADEEQAREKKYTNHVYELAEVLQSVIKSPLHTYRINGYKVGAENSAPTLGLLNASGEDQ